MQIHAVSSEHWLDWLTPRQAKLADCHQEEGTLQRSCIYAILINKKQMQDFPVPDEFTMVVRLTTIVNSSGTGKSRMVDQLGKEIITVPIPVSLV